MSAAFRPTMTALVTETRRLIGDPAPADSQGKPAYWEDTAIQDALDDHRLDLYRLSLCWQPTYTGSAPQYLTATALHEHFETTQGGSAVFVIEDAAGNNVGTASYTPDYRRGIITFTTDQMGTAYFLTGRSYDLYAAAADILDWWVVAEPADCLTDEQGRRYYDSTRAKARAARADKYRSLARPSAVPLSRGDVT